jgi:hypothetical protein
LSFGGEAGHIGDDRFFLTAIQTQGLLLYMRFVALATHAPYCSDQLKKDIYPFAAGSPSALVFTD